MGTVESRRAHSQHFFFQIDLSFCQVTSLQNLQQQPAPSWNPYGGAQGFSNPYMRQGGIGASATWGGYGQPQPQQPSGIGASATWGGYTQPPPQQPSGIGASATWGGYGQPSYPYSSYPQMPSFGGIG